MGFWKDIRAVIQREIMILANRPLYWMGTIVTMAFCMVFCLTFFRDGLPHDLPIAVVDNDNSSLSRNFIRQLNATQLGESVRFQTFADARLAMQSGKVTSIIVLPEGLSRQVQAQRQPRIEYYLNGLYFVGGALAYKDILMMINLANGAYQREVLRMKGYSDNAIMGMIQPIIVDTHQIGNAYTNYGYYLSNILLPGFLELIIIIVMIYSIGTELKYGTSRQLMKVAGNSVVKALLGKVFVATIAFTILGVILVLTLYHWMHFPIAGSIGNMFLDIFLLVLASEAVGITLIGFLPVPRLALSIGALYSVLAFSLSGFTMPLEAMSPWIQGLGAAFPLRHYYLFYVQEVVFGAGFAGWWKEVVYLLIFLLVPLVILPRLKNAFIFQNYPKD